MRATTFPSLSVRRMKVKVLMEVYGDPVVSRDPRSFLVSGHFSNFGG